MLPQPTIARRTRSMVGRRASLRFNTTRAIAGSSVASELDGQRLQTAQREALAIRRRVRHQLEPRDAAYERVDGDLAFHARERRAEAEVDTPAEGDVTVVGPREVQAVGIGELRRVAVSGADEGHDHLTLADRPAPDPGFRARHPRRALHGPVVPQELLDGARDEPRRFAQAAQLARVLQERQDPVADQVDGRLVAGDEQEDARRDQLLLVELVARLLGGDERRQEIAARRGAALGDETAEVVADGAASGRAAPRHLRIGRQPDRVETAGDVEAPTLEALVIRDRDAQYLADDIDGDRVGELLDHVHRAHGLGARDEIVDDLPNAGPQPLDDTRRERLADEAPEPRVVRRIAIQHREPDSAGHLGAEAGGDERGQRLLDEAWITQHRRHVLVAGEHPEAEWTVVNGVFGAKAVVGRIRIRQELRVHRIEALHVARRLYRLTSAPSRARSAMARRRPARAGSLPRASPS